MVVPPSLFRSKSAKEALRLEKERRKREEIEQKELWARQPNTRFPPTQVLYADPSFAEPPPLNYTLRTRKKAIAMFWGLIIVDCIFMPIVLYFCLWYLTSLSHNAVFSISTGLLGTVSIVEYFIRFHRLWKKNSNCRVIGARRYYLDFFHWNLSIAWMAVMVELIVGTVPREPPIRLLAMPVSSMLYAFGVQMLIIDILRYFNIRAPIRISSLPRGSLLRPGIYSIIEDVVAVDGSGGTEFRQRLNLRYLASHYFREMLHRLTLFWAVGALICAAVTTVLIFTTHRNVAYVLGWTIPFGWAGVWTWITIIYVKHQLKVEREVWKKGRTSPTTPAASGPSSADGVPAANRAAPPAEDMAAKGTISSAADAKSTGGLHGARHEEQRVVEPHPIANGDIKEVPLANGV